MDEINKICEEFNENIKKINIDFFNLEEDFDNPIYSNCILKITENKIAFANIDKLCKYFDFFEKYKNFNDMTNKYYKKEIKLYEINKENYNIYNYIKLVYNIEDFNVPNLMKPKYIGEYVYLSNVLGLKNNFKIKLYEYIKENISEYEEMNFECINDESWDELMVYIINNCSNDRKMIDLIYYWKEFFNEKTTILIRNNIKAKFKDYSIHEIISIYKDCSLLNINNIDDLLVFNFVPFEIILIDKKIKLSIINQRRKDKHFYTLEIEDNMDN